MLSKFIQLPEKLTFDHIETVKQIRAAIINFPKKYKTKNQDEMESEVVSLNSSSPSHTELFGHKFNPLGF